MTFTPPAGLVTALSAEIVKELLGVTKKSPVPKVAEAAMIEPPEDGLLPEDIPAPVVRALENLARDLVETLLSLSGRELSTGDMEGILHKAAFAHLKSIGAKEQIFTARLASLAPKLVNLPRLAAWAGQGVKLSPLQATSARSGRELVVGPSEEFKQVLKNLEQVAGTDLPVLLTGETGVGKEMLAQRLHQLSPRKSRPFVPLNCAALSPNLLESELFGHEKGAFTGAGAARAGYFDSAQGGTLFLDEIAESTKDFQVMLLRVLEDGLITPVGKTKARKIDFRLVCATHLDLAKEAEEGRFHQGLLHRIMVIPLNLPPLRQRPEDLPCLIDHFMEQACFLIKRTRRLHPKTREKLLSYSWPGNVRQLKNVLQRLVALSSDFEIKEDLLPPEINRPVPGDLAGLITGTTKVPKNRVQGICRVLQEKGSDPFSNQDLRKELNCSDTTAKNILRALADAGIVEVTGKQGGRRYHLLEK